MKTKTLTTNVHNKMINFEIIDKNYAADDIVAKLDSTVSGCAKLAMRVVISYI